MADRAPCCRHCGGVLVEPKTASVVECGYCGKKRTSGRKPLVSVRPEPEAFEGLPLDEPLVDEETWQKAGKALVASVVENEPVEMLGEPLD